jgi:hypothetical protein
MGGQTSTAKKPAPAVTTSPARPPPNASVFTPAYTPATPAYLGTYDDDLGVCTMEPPGGALESRVEIPPQLRLDAPAPPPQSSLDLRSAAKVPDDTKKKTAPDAQGKDPVAADAANNLALATGSQPTDTAGPSGKPGSGDGGSGQASAPAKEATQASDEGTERRPAPRALPRAGIPETGPVALRWAAVQLSVTAPPYLASPTLGVEPTKPPAAPGDKQQQPLPKLPDYRGAYARAIDGGARFHALIVGAARRLASQARDQNEEYRRRQESTLAVTLRSFDDRLNFNRTSLRTGRDILLSKVQSQAWSLRAGVSSAASTAHGKLTSQVSGYRTQIDGLRTSGDAVVQRAFGGIADVETTGLAASKALVDMKTAIPDRFDIADSYPKMAARNEAVRTFLPLRVDKLRTNIDDTRKKVTASLTESFACLKCNIDSSRQAFEYSTMIVEKPAHAAVDAAAAGGYKAIDSAAVQLTLAIEESFARSDVGLVEQHRAMRAGAVGNAQEIARQERAALADAAMRQVAALSAVAGAQATAGAKVRDTLARDKTLAEPAFASSVTQASTRFAQNIGNVGKVHPRSTAEAADKLHAGRMQRAAGYERGQAASMLATERSFEKIVTDSLAALGRHIAETLGSLESVPGDVRKSCDGSLQPLDDAFFNGLADYRDSIARLSASVEAVLSLQAPTEVTPSKKREQKDNGKDVKDVKGDKAGGKGKQASTIPPPPAPPASCAGCPPPQQKDKAAKKEEGNSPDLTKNQAGDGQTSKVDANNNNASAGSDSKAGGVCQVQAPNPKSPDEFIKSNRKIAQNPWGVAPFAAFVESSFDKVCQEVNKRADTIHAKMSWSSTNRKGITEQLKGITKLQGVAIEHYYNFVYDPDLREAIDSQLRSKWSTRKTNNNNVAEAINALNGDPAASAFSGLTAAFNWSNEFDRAKQILLDMTPAQLEQMRNDHGDELKGFANELDGTQKEIFLALIAGHPEEARAIELRGELDKNDYKEKQKRADDNDKLVETALNEGYTDAAYMDKDATTADAFGLGKGAGEALTYDLEDKQAVEDKRQEHIQKMETAFGFLPGVIEMGGGTQSTMAGSALYYYATRTPDWNLDYYRRYPPPPGSPAHDRMKQLEAAPPSPYRQEMASQNKLVIEMMLRHGPNSDQAKGARLLKERQRTGEQKPEDLDKALHVGLGDAREGGGYGQKEADRRAKGREDSEKERDKIFLLSEQFRAQLGIDPLTPVATNAKDARAAVQADIEKNYPKDDKARAVALGILESDSGNLDAVVEYAASKEKTELLTTYLGRRDRQEIKKFTENYNATHPVSIEKRLGLFDEHWSMGNMNGAVFSGDKANKLEIAWMGVPANTKERSEVALRIMDQAIDQAGALGSFLASGEYEALKANARLLREKMGVTPDMVDSHGEIRTHDPLTGLPVEYGHFDKNGELRQEYKGDKNALSVAMGMAQMYADNYNEATDRIAGFVTMALVIAAAVITTALTGGAAASIWLPMLVTAGAGLVGIGLTAAIKGGRYGRDDLVRDLAMTVVQTLTAGIGAAGSVAARGGMPALRAVASRGVSQGFRISEKALEKFVICKGGTLAASASFGAELGIAAGSGALSGGVVAALDPANKESGEYGSRILGGMFRGAAGSMVGAGVARGVSTGLGAVGNRIAGAAASRSASSALANGMSREQAVEQALLAARRAQWVSGGITRALASGASGSTSRMTELGLEGKASWDEILAEGRTAFIQNMLQGAIEHVADPGVRIPYGKGAKLTEGDLRKLPSWQRDEYEHTRAMAEGAVGKAYDKPAAAPDKQPAAPRRGPSEPPEPVNDNERRAAATASGEHDGRTVPARPRDEPGGPPSGRPLTEEPGSLAPGARAHEEPEVRARLRSVDGRDDDPADRGEITKKIKLMRLSELLTSTEPRLGPISDTVDMTPDMLRGGRSIPELSSFRATDPKDPVAARRNYEALRANDPHREVLLARNLTTGEFMVIQGGPHSVESPPHGWVTERHSHPRLISDVANERLVRAMPSATDGDLVVLKGELDRLHATVPAGTTVRRDSVIDTNINGVHGQTLFSISRTGDQYTITVSFRPPQEGVRSLGPYKSIADYEKAAFKLTGVDFSQPGDKTVRTVTGPRAAIGEALTAQQRADADFIAQRAGLAEPPGPARRAAGPEDVPDAPALRALTRGEAIERVRAMGLVDRQDSMVRLHNILNDSSLPPESRSLIARMVLEATRESMIRNGKLDDGDELMLFFHGAEADQFRGYREGGIDMRRGPGSHADDDVGPGLYMSQDFQSAERYIASGGAVTPFLVTRKQLGNVVDLRPGSLLRGHWESFFARNAPMFGDLAAATMLRGPGGFRLASGDPLPITAGGFGLFGMGKQRRGELVAAFLAEVAQNPAFPDDIRRAAAQPHLIMTDLGGPATYGNDRGFITDQAAFRTQEIADLINKQMGFGRFAANDNDPASPRMRAVMAAAPPPEPDATRQIAGGMLRGLRGGAFDPEGHLAILMRLAPEATTDFFARVARAARRGDTPAPNEEDLMRMTLEMRARGAPPDLVATVRNRFMAIADPEHGLYLRVAEAGIQSGFGAGLRGRLDEAFERRAALEAARKFGFRGAVGADRQLVRDRLQRDGDAVLRLMLDGGTDRERAIRYARERVRQGEPLADALRDGLALVTAFDSTGFAKVRDRVDRQLASVNRSSRVLADLVRNRPDRLLGLAHTNPDHLAAMYVDLVFKRAASGQFAPPTPERLGRYVGSRMISNLLPVASEMSVVWSLHEMGLTLLKADAAQRGGANRPGLDIVAFGLLNGPRPPRGPVHVMVADDKAYRRSDGLGINELQGVSAMQGRRYGENLRTTALEIRAGVARLRAAGLGADPEYRQYMDGAIAAARQMEKAGKAILRIPVPAKDPAKTARIQSWIYARAIAKIMEANNITQVITSRHGNINALARWLRWQGFVLEEEYLWRLAAMGAFGALRER